MEHRLRVVAVAALAALLLSAPVRAAEDEEDIAKNPEKAIKKFTTATQKAPEDPDGWYNLGIAYFNNKQVAEAGQAMTKAVELGPQDPKAHYWMGRILASQKKTDAAVAEFRKVAELDPPVEGAPASAMYLDSMSKMAETYMDAERWDDAIEAYRAALKGKPANAAPFYNQLGAAYLKKGDTDQALKWFERLIESAPDTPATYYNLGFTYRKIAAGGNSAFWGKSADMFVKYASMASGDVVAQFFAGEALVMAKRNSEALPYLERYLAGDPGGKKAIAKFGNAGKTDVYDAALEYKAMLTK